VLCGAALFPTTASALRLTGPPSAAPAQALTADISLDGVKLSDRSYPSLYQEFSLKTQRFLQDFELKVVLNGKEYYLRAADIDFNINTFDLLDQLMFNNNGDAGETTYISSYSYDQDKAKAFADNIMDELDATVPPIIDYSPTFNLQTMTFIGKSAPSQMIGYDLGRSSFLNRVYESIDGAIWNEDDHHAVLDLTANPVYSQAVADTSAGYGLLGTYTTHTTDVPNRNTNISLASRSLNGYTLRSGGVFSFNNTLGYTSADKGYLEAGVYVNGVLETGLGGGICQISSTLYNAVLGAGMGVIERHEHSGPVTYVPPGRDATVSYGGPDFRFQNNTAHECHLVFQYGNRSLTVSIYGKR